MISSVSSKSPMCGWCALNIHTGKPHLHYIVALKRGDALCGYLCATGDVVRSRAEAQEVSDKVARVMRDNVKAGHGMWSGYEPVTIKTRTKY